MTAHVDMLPKGEELASKDDKPYQSKEKNDIMIPT